MAKRLNQALRDFNIGKETVIAFLAKKGHTVADDLNAKLDDDQYFLLAKEFDKDRAAKLEAERLSASLHPKSAAEKAETAKPAETTAKPETVEKVQEKTSVPKSEPKTEPEPKQVPVKVEPAVAVQTSKQEPKAEKRQEPDIESKTEIKAGVKPETLLKSELEKETKSEIKSEHTPKIKPEKSEQKTENKDEKTDTLIDRLPKLNVIGQIDLDSQKTESRSKRRRRDRKRKRDRERVHLQQDITPEHQQNRNRNEQTKPQQQKPQQQVKQDIKAKAEKPEKLDKVDRKSVSQRDETPFRYGEKPQLKGITVVDVIDLNEIPEDTRPLNGKKGKDGKRRKRGGKRERIRSNKVDVSKEIVAEKPKSISSERGGGSGEKGKSKEKSSREKYRSKPIKKVINEEEIDKTIRETKSLIASGGKKSKTSKHNRDKRERVKEEREKTSLFEQEQETVLKLTEFVTANELAIMMDVPVTKVIATCMSIGMMVSINQRLDAETINIVAEEFGFTTQFVSAEVVEALGKEEEPDVPEDLKPRAPIVTVMGHVDHGKTSLLDYIRKTNVIAGEAGGITQHIGAYNVKLENGQRITFLDTPGHEAFTAMRARGAKVTDIVIIIVAADDDIMPQTIEAINHASAAGVPIVFAINKIDKAGAIPEKIKEGLSKLNYLVEDWGGKYQSQDISAKKGIGVEELLEKVLLEAELLDLKANPARKAVGSVIESSLDKGRGYVSTVLVSNGTLNQGDILLSGTFHGKIKAMFNERNQRIKTAGPSEPVEILGLNGAPQAGENFNVMASEQEAREIANRREQLQREMTLRAKKHFGLDELGRRIALGDFKELNIIVKGDVDGSVEALSDSLLKLSTAHIQVNVIHKAVGAISDSDVLLADASNAIICGFQVRPTASARKIAEKEDIDIRLYSVIYDAIEEIKSAMEGMLSPEIKEEVTATIEVLEVFNITKVGKVAGCLVREGKVARNNKVRLIRDGIVVFSGEISALKRMKDDVKEVGTNFECGISIKNCNDIKIGDMIESYEETEVKKTL